jgi:hypothetical protein
LTSAGSCFTFTRFYDADLREFPAVARALDPAEGESGVRLHGLVDEDDARLNLRGECFALGRVRRPDARREPEA